MIVYSGTKAGFRRDTVNGVIAEKIDELFTKLGITPESISEFNSWKNSLPYMANIISDSRIDDEVGIALEYQIPLTSKRVDFMVAGNDGTRDNIVIIELKQWTECTALSRENIVRAFTGGAEREVVHPSQQAYSYAKFIENFNEEVRENNIGLIPCAYLHNYREDRRSEIMHPNYSEAISDAPVFLRRDGTELQSFLARFVARRSEKPLFDIVEKGKLKPSVSLQSAVGRILNGNNEFIMIDEQQVAYATVLKLVQSTIDSDRKHTIIVQGGPGTGKSVIAINLLAKIINNNYSCVYVTKNGAPRYTFSEALIRGKHSLTYLKGLFKGSGSFIDVPNNTFDCILADEAHRLNLKSGMYGNQGESQIKEIIRAAKISVFFVDEDQIVTMKDIGRISEIKKQAELLGSTVHCGESLKLLSQFRCNGSDGYIAYLDYLLDIRKTANTFFELDYEVGVFENPCEMREALRQRNGNNKSRMIAGYCYPWVSKKDKTKFDIILDHGFEAQWNFDTNSFATGDDSFEQVGCIHSTQGIEFDYVGVIIGPDMQYRDGRVITDYKQRASQDASIRGVSTERDRELADTIIRNTYKTLLSRGQKGCYIYCQDKELSDYFRRYLPTLSLREGKLIKTIPVWPREAFYRKNY